MPKFSLTSQALLGVDVYGNPVLNFCWHTNHNNKNKSPNFSKIALFDLFLKKNGIKKKKSCFVIGTIQPHWWIYILIIYRLEFCFFSALKMSKYIRTFQTSKVNFKINEKIIEKLSFACCFHKNRMVKLHKWTENNKENPHLVFDRFVHLAELLSISTHIYVLIAMDYPHDYDSNE